MADEAASRHAYDDALAWLGVVQAIGDQLPGVYERKREAWRAQLTSAR